MKAKQLELLLPHSHIHRYQLLDALSDVEEKHLNLSPDSSCQNTSIDFSPTRTSDGFTHHYGLPSANPYARIPGEIEPTNNDPSLTAGSTITAKYFSREASRILRQYSPTVGKSRRLRPEFRAFVATNASKPPAGRAQILSELQKYDLAANGFAEPLFNREMSDRVLKKLIQLGNQ